MVCELERETDHLIDDLKRAYRQRGFPTCSRSPEGRLFRALKEVEEQTDTLHYRIRNKRSTCAQAEAFAAIRCAFEEAEDLLCRVRLDRHITKLVHEVGCRIDRLGHDFDRNNHARQASYGRDFDRHDRRLNTYSPVGVHRQPHRGNSHPEPHRPDTGYAHFAASQAGGDLETILLARLLQSLGR